MRALLSLWAIIVLLLATSIIYTHQQELLIKKPIYSDYGKFYESAKMSLKGKNPYSPIYYLFAPSKKEPHPTFKRLGPNLNPPFFNLLILPLGKLNYLPSFYLWQILSVISGIFSVLLLKKALDLSSTPLFTLSLIAALFIYFPTYSNIWLGQVALFTFVFILGALLAIERGFTSLAAVLLAIVSSIKLFFGLFALYFLIRREWRAFFWYSLTIVICALIPLLIFGKSIYSNYQSVFEHIYWYASSWNASLKGFFLRLFNGEERNIPLWSIPKLAPILYYSFSAVVLAFTVKCLWPEKKIPSQQKIVLDFSIILVAILLISPLGWMYYFSFLFIPFCFLLKLAHEGHYPYTLRLMTGLIVVLTAIPYYLKPAVDISDHLFIIGWAACYTYGLVCLFALLIFIRHYLAKQPQAGKDNCPYRLVIMLYIAALLPSFAGILTSTYNFSGHAVTPPPLVQTSYWGT